MSPANILLVIILSVMVAHLKNLHANVVQLRAQFNLTATNLDIYKENTDKRLESLTESVSYLQEKYPEMELRITAAENTALAAHETRSSKNDSPTPSESEMASSSGNA